MPDYERQFRDAQALGWEGAYRATESYSRVLTAAVVLFGAGFVTTLALWFGLGVKP